MNTNNGNAVKQRAELLWFALRVSPDQRLMEIAAKYLRMLGFVAELATEQRLRRRHKREKVRRLQTFASAPGYVFLGMRPDQKVTWKQLRDCHIIKSFVSRNGVPAQLDHNAVMRFLRMEETGLPEYYRWFKTGSEFAIGDTVLITKGPLADFEMRVEDVRDGEAIFRMLMLNREIEARVPVNDCIKTEAA